MRRIACLSVHEPAAPLASAQRDLLEVALGHSPRVEEGGPGLVYLDVSGLRAIFGDEDQIARRLLDAAAERGLRARVAIAGSRIGALVACRWRDGITVVEPGDEARYLAPAPVSLLDVSAELAARFHRWGIRTLGDLAALPAAPLFERLGAEGVALQHLARGDDPRPLRPWSPPVFFEESAELDGAVETLGPVADLAAMLAGRIADQLVRHGLSADQLEWICHLADHGRHEGSFAPAVPLFESAAIVTLLRASLDARPPHGRVTAVTVRARPVRVPPAQSSLIDPSRSSPRLVAAALARVAALVGAQQIGVPALVDSHRPDAVVLASYHFCDAPPPAPPRSTAAGAVPDRSDRDSGRPALAFRRFRPRVAASVVLVAGRPVELRSRRLAARIVKSVGPWRASGQWWTDAPWLADEWDVELGDGVVCRLSHDGSAWWLDGLYD